MHTVIYRDLFIPLRGRTTRAEVVDMNKVGLFISTAAMSSRVRRGLMVSVIGVVEAAEKEYDGVVDQGVGGRFLSEST